MTNKDTSLKKLKELSIMLKMENSLAKDKVEKKVHQRDAETVKTHGNDALQTDDITAMSSMELHKKGFTAFITGDIRYD